MPADVVLQTWKQISEYVGRTERTVQRWEQDFGFPVHRPAGKSRSSVMALAQEINEWTRGKPSLVVIRRSTRLTRERLLSTGGYDCNSGDDEKQAKFDDLSRFSTAESARGEMLQRVTFERASRAESLWEQQRKLREDLRSLLSEQRKVREKLRLQTTQLPRCCG